MQCLTASGQWAVELLQCRDSLLVGSGRRYLCNAVPHYLGAVGMGTRAMQPLTAPG